MASQHIFSRYDKMQVKVQDLNVTGTLTAAGSDITAALAELGTLDGLTASAAELNFNDTALAGTAVASKTLVLGATKNVDTLVIADGGLYLGAGAGTAVTATAAELNVVDNATAGTAVASKAMVLDANKFFDWAVSSASTDGGASVEPLNFDVTMTGIGGVGGRAKFTLTTAVALGSWSNALKAQMTYSGASAKTTGMGSAMVAEMSLSGGCADGTYAPYEAELNMPTGALTGTATSFLYMSVQGDDKGTFDTSGYIFDVAGVTVNADKVFQASAKSAINATHALRIRIAGTPYFIPLHTSAGFGV